MTDPTDLTQRCHKIQNAENSALCYEIHWGEEH